MVTVSRLIRYLSLFLLLLPLFLFCGEFSASVNQNQVGLGEGFTLNLTLKEASPKSSPSIELSKNEFLIHSQQQSSNTVIINGKIDSSIVWKLVLIAQREGEVAIPPISIETSHGTLTTEPIKINVVKKTGSNSAEPANHDSLLLTTIVSNERPYKNEPVFYTVKLASKQNLANIQMQKLNIEDAIVEHVGEPVVSDEVVDGIRIGTVKFNYLITPLKTGLLKIPSNTVQGGIPVKRNSRIRSLFDDAFDPFSFMQGFDSLNPFALATEEVVLEVQPPLADINPWIPAKSLVIKEIWDGSQLLQTGEFFTRSFEIIADGLHSSQLPSLEDQQISGNMVNLGTAIQGDKVMQDFDLESLTMESDHSQKVKATPIGNDYSSNDYVNLSHSTAVSKFKVYADKPELTDEIKDGQVKSIRKESYTLIPQESGLLTLPEISVTWWDVVNKKKMVARIPSKTLNVLPAADHALKSGLLSVADQKKSVREIPKDDLNSMNPVFYVVVGVLIVLLVIAIVWGILLQQKMKRLLEPSTVAPPAATRTHALPTQNNKKPPRIFQNRKTPQRSKQERLNDLNPT